MNRLLTAKRTHGFRLISLIVGVVVLSTGMVQAQNTSVRSQVADLSQKFTELEQKYNLLKLEVENLTAENNRLKQEIALSKSSTSNEEIEKIVSARLEEYRKATELYVRQQQEKFLTLLSSKIDNVAQANTGTIAQPTTATTTTSTGFSVDFPKKGQTYTVKSGDTLSRIAKKFGSTVKDIQNANNLADPNNVRIGQELFIPFEQK